MPEPLREAMMPGYGMQGYGIPTGGLGATNFGQAAPAFGTPPGFGPMAGAFGNPPLSHSGSLSYTAPTLSYQPGNSGVNYGEAAGLGMLESFEAGQQRLSGSITAGLGQVRPAMAEAATAAFGGTDFVFSSPNLGADEDQRTESGKSRLAALGMVPDAFGPQTAILA